MINYSILKNAIIAGAENIARHYEKVDAINVFPVPDGDTGTNLRLTLEGCANAVAKSDDMPAGKLADFAAGELLRCARGNSGVIFSLIFKGFAQSVENLDFIDAKALADGIEKGCNEAYAAIDKPTEGTILTAVRIAASKAHSAAEKGADAQKTFEAALEGARNSLKSSQNLLPVLKKKGVVDAGAQGLVYIMEGMAGYAENSYKFTETSADYSSAEYNEKYIYCTEFIISNSKHRDVSDLKRFLSEIGECPAAAEHSGIIKIHVHTDSPHLAIEKGLEYGELSRIKIDNMKLQIGNNANGTERKHQIS